MNATPPEANTEYSRGPRGSRGASAVLERGPAGEVDRAASRSPGGSRTAIVTGGVVGAVLLVVAEFTTLFTVHAAGLAAPVRSVTTGAHHSYALLPIALLAAALAVAASQSGSRPALLALGLLGVVALLIAVLGDLPDAGTSGLVVRGGRYLNASATAGAGVYLETLGAVILLATSVGGLVLLGGAPRRPRRR